jgi:predicted NUDIX family NTP pyrophosphohydrolase
MRAGAVRARRRPGRITPSEAAYTRYESMRQTAKRSAGILLYRHRGRALEVLLAHPGGPFWRARDAGVWTIPKGGIDEGEEALDAALREFNEETGFVASPPFIALTPRRQKSGKLVLAWAARGDCDPAALASLHFTMEWPPRSGRMQSFPEIDRAEWFGLEPARAKILAGQRPFLDELEARLGRAAGEASQGEGS